MTDAQAARVAENALTAAILAAIEPPPFIKEAVNQSLEEARLRNIAEGRESDEALGSNCELTEEEAQALRDFEPYANISLENLADSDDFDDSEDHEDDDLLEAA